MENHCGHCFNCTARAALVASVAGTRKGAAAEFWGAIVTMQTWTLMVLVLCWNGRDSELPAGELIPDPRVELMAMRQAIRFPRSEGAARSAGRSFSLGLRSAGVGLGSVMVEH
jgi:hypothetical protein